jgi:hypothetical protein
MSTSGSHAAESPCDGGVVVEVKYSLVWSLTALVSGAVLLGAALHYLDALGWKLTGASVLHMLVAATGVVMLVWALLRGIPQKARARVRLFADRLVYSPKPGEVLATLRSRSVKEILRLGHGNVGFVVGDLLVCVRPLNAGNARRLAESAADTWQIQLKQLSPLANWWRSVAGLHPYDLRTRSFEYESDEVIAE